LSKISFSSSLENNKLSILYELKDSINKLEMIKIKNNHNNIELYDNNKLNFDDFKILINNNKPFKLIWNNIVLNITNYN